MRKVQAQNSGQNMLIDIGPQQLSQGLYQLLDDTVAPIGSARVMVNAMITDRGGIAPRPGTELLGTYDESITPMQGSYCYVKSNGGQEVPVKVSNGIMKYYHESLNDWHKLKSGYSVDSEFGFKESLVNTENEDYLYFGDKVANYSRWSGSMTVTDGNYISGTSLTVESTLKPTIFETGTSTATSTTTITDSSKNWASSQWVNFYIQITSGSQSGKISKITASTANQLTFDAITDPVAGCTYNIRLPKFPISGTLTVDGSVANTTANSPSTAGVNSSLGSIIWNNVSNITVHDTGRASVTTATGTIPQALGLDGDTADRMDVFIFGGVGRVASPGISNFDDGSWSATNIDAHWCRATGTVSTTLGFTVDVGNTVAGYVHLYFWTSGVITSAYSIPFDPLTGWDVGTITVIPSAAAQYVVDQTIPVIDPNSQYLTATNFNLNIPADATITGVKVEIEQRCTSGTLNENSVKLIIGGAITGVDKSTGAVLPASDTYVQYGSFFDLWSQTLTPAILNASNFGVAFAVTGAAGLTAEVNHIRISVAYSSTNSLNVVYSGIDSATSFVITDPGFAIPDGIAVTVQPTEYPSNPRGNRFELHYTRMIIGNVVSALSRDSGGALQGSQSTGSWYYSKGGIAKFADPTNFTFAATRVAGEGGIESVPYGGGDITDIVNQEDSFYVFKRNYIEQDKFSQDSNDLPLRTQLKSGFGSVYKTTKGKDDIYFVTQDNQITSVQRVKSVDILPQSVNIGITIKRLLDTYDFTQTHGTEFKNRLFFACKSSTSVNYNDQIVVYNLRTKSFEGVWQLGTSGFFTFNKELYYSEAAGPNVWKMFTGYNDVRGINNFGISMQWRTNWAHIAPRSSSKSSGPSQFETIGLNTLAIEGFILDGSSFTVGMFMDYSNTASLEFTFGNSDGDSGFIQTSNLTDFLGANPLGLEPIGAISDPDSTGLRHFMFIVYFPDIYGNHVSFGIDSTGTDQYFEIIRIASDSSTDPMRQSSTIKTL